MRYTLVILTFLLVVQSYGQPIPDFKSDEECLQFLRNKVKGLANFYFDTLFTRIELEQMKPSFKSWTRADLNGDKKHDLLFVGSFADRKYDSHTAMIYISDGDRYKLVPIIRRGYTSFRPHAFTQKQNGQTHIVIQNYTSSEFRNVESLLRNEELSRKNFDGDDTLMCKFGSILNFYSYPSNLVFDSLALVIRYGFSCSADSFIVYNNGTGRYYSGCNYQSNIPIEFEESIAGINYLKNIIQTIDFDKIEKESFVGMTDLNSADLRIYHVNKVEHFHDYGLELSFTLKALYKHFEELQQTF